MGYEINFHVRDGDVSLLQSPFYEKYSSTTFGNLSPVNIKNDIKNALASNESAAVVAYLSWLLRVLALVA